MIGLMLLLAVSMAIKDAFYTAVTVLVSHGHPWAASIFDILGDIASVLSLGVGGVEVVSHGVSWETVILLSSMSVGSLLGTVAGAQIGKRVEHRLE